MKKKKNNKLKKLSLLYLFLSLLFIVLFCFLLFSFKYEKVKLKDCSFNVYKDYNYTFNKKYSSLDNSNFKYSAIFVSNNSYSDMIDYAKDFIINGKVIDTEVNSFYINGYQSFVINKNLYYIDNNDNTNFYIILVNLNDSVLVYSFEVPNRNHNRVYKNVLKGLKKIKKN